MPEISQLTVTSDPDGVLEILAIARPDDPQAGQEIWLTRELPVPAGTYPAWPIAWQSLGSVDPAGQLDAIAVAADADGSLVAVAQGETNQLWHTRQDGADGKWAKWESLGNPASHSSLSPPALIKNHDGRLELFTVSRIPRLQVWHCSQLHASQDQWSGWSSLGFPPGQNEVMIAAPTTARNEDGRLEVYIVAGGQIWHSWQKSPGAAAWMPWESLGQPADLEVGPPTAALDVDGCLQLLVACGPDVWVRGQHQAGQSWDPWKLLTGPGGGGFADLAVAAQSGGRLVLFILRTMPDGTATLKKIEQQGGLDKSWASGDPVQDDLLDTPAVPKAANPVLVMDNRKRLRLFLSVPGQASIYTLLQVNEDGEKWQEAWFNFGTP